MKFRRLFKMYVEEVCEDGSEFELVFEIDGNVVDKKTEYCIEDCMIDSYEFSRNNCEKYGFDSRSDRLEIDLSFRMGM